MKKTSEQNIIAIETCTNICSVAILNQGTLYETVEQRPRMHSKLLLPMIQELLKKANLKMSEIDAIACSRGPGSFTGVRIGVGVAKGLAYGQDIPIIGVSPLAALAVQAMQIESINKITVILDARMGELYAASYEVNNNQLCPVGVEQILSIEQLDGSKGVFIGTGVGEYQDELAKRKINTLAVVHPLASGILALIDTDFSEKTTAKDFRPVYLRNKVVD